MDKYPELLTSVLFIGAQGYACREDIITVIQKNKGSVFL